MNMGKKTKVILMCTLIATLSAFGASKYEFGKQKNLKAADNFTYSINSEIIQSEAKQIEDSIKAADVVAEQKIDIAIAQPQIKDKLPLSRGGNVVSTPKPQVKSKPKTLPKTVSKNTTITVSVQADAEKDLFYRLVSAEAEGEPFEGQVAVATVIMNRVKDPDFPNSIKGVIMDKAWGYQFTPVMDGRINNSASASAKKAVDKVLSGYRSFGSEVMWFVNPKKSQSPWIMQNKTYFKTIGNHDFYY
jgi:spore germination cell wall hydrolase CwlJ-like protein